MTMQLFPRGENAHIMAMFVSFFSTSPQLLFVSYLSVFTGPGLQPPLMETWMIPKQETGTMFLNPYLRIPKGLMEQDTP